MPSESLSAPWGSFLSELDTSVDGAVELHCMGGFVITQHYGLDRATADFDALMITPPEQRDRLLAHGMRGGPLHKKYGVYLDFVTIATVPEDYDQRLVDFLPGTFKHLRLLVLDPYDLVLSKLERNTRRDREDAGYLARTVPLDLGLLRQRYEKELRPYLGNPRREDLTLQLWIEALEEQRSR